jgi:hypothetical protein
MLADEVGAAVAVRGGVSAGVRPGVGATGGGVSAGVTFGVEAAGAAGGDVSGGVRSGVGATVGTDGAPGEPAPEASGLAQAQSATSKATIRTGDTGALPTQGPTMAHRGQYDDRRSGYDERRSKRRQPLGCGAGGRAVNVGRAMKNAIDTELAPLLANARILVFEYDRDGFLMSASGSCLGGSDPALEVRSGLVSPDVVRRAVGGAAVVEQLSVHGRRIAMRHDPVRGPSGRIDRVVVTAVDVTDLGRSHEGAVPAWLAALP